MYSKKCFDSRVVPESNDRSGSGGSFNRGMEIFPFEQHIPGQYVYTTYTTQCK